MRYVTTILLLCLTLSVHAQEHAESNPTHVQIIHSYHADLTWTRQMQESLVNHLRDIPNLLIHTEYLDTKRQPLGKIEEQLVAFMDVRLKGHRSDVIVVCDNNALDFVLRHRKRLFPETPIVFCGINGDLPFDADNRPPNMTGIMEQTSPGRTLMLMRQLQPKLSRVYLVSDQTPTGRAERAQALAQFHRVGLPVECIDLSTLSLSEIQAQIATLDPQSDAVLLTVFNRDPDGQYYAYEQSAHAIASATEANVYGLWDFYLGHGIMGGHMTCAGDQGRAAALRVRCILEGQSADHLPITEQPANHDVVDADRVAKAGLAFADLPIGVSAVREGEVVYVSSPRQLLRLGVLANSGKPACLRQWQATANHLSASVDQVRVEVVPLSFDQIPGAVENRTVDLLLCNPALFLKSQLITDIKPIATLIRMDGHRASDQFGGVIFWSATNSHIQSLMDTGHRPIAAVDPNSFGGYVMQQKTLHDAGIAAPSNIIFTGSHQSVVLAVRDGKADIGWVRTGTLERMAAAGEIDLRAFHVWVPADEPENQTPICSTSLYPEWPMASLPHVDSQIVRQLGISLLTIQPEDHAAVHGDYHGWTTSHAYERTKQAMVSAGIEPFAQSANLHLLTLAARYWPWIAGLAAAMLFWAMMTLYILRFNRQLSLAGDRLEKSEQHLSATLHSIGDGVIATDAKGMVTDLNPVAEHLIGMSLQDARGHYVDDVFQIIHGDTRQTIDNPIHTSLREGKVVELANNTVLIAVDATERQIADSCAPIRDRHNRIVGAVLVFRDVSEEYAHRERLRESKQRFDELAELSRHVAWEIDTEGLFTYISHVAADVYGYQPQEIVNHLHFYDIHPREQCEAFTEKIFGIMQRRGIFKNLLHPMMTKDGRQVWIETNGIPQYDADATLIGYRGSDTDVTERVNAEKALNEKENLLRTLIDMLPDLVWLKDTQGVYLVCNKRFEDFFGQDQKSIIGKTDYDFVDREVADAFRTHDHHAMRFRETHINEERITFARDGHQEILETIKKPLIDPSGQVLGVLGVGRDISVRKASEIQLRKLSQAIDQMAASVVITDTDGSIEYVNPAFTKNTGYQDDEAIGQNPRILKSGRMKPEVYQQMWATLKQGGTWRGELQNRRKDGTYFWELATIAPVKDFDGHTTHYVAVKEEISARKTMEAKLVHEAQTDTLTGLANRSVFYARLEHAIAMAHNQIDTRFAVLFLDFDRFKTINDSLGHDVGDLLLKDIARRLNQSLLDDPEDDENPKARTTLISRFGGDEFVVLIEKLDCTQTAIDKADHILDVLSQPYQLAGYDIYSTASIGIVVADRTVAHSVADILRDADTAMYEAKLAGRGCHCVFDEAMRSRVQTRMNLENDLRKVIHGDQLYFQYQPIVDLQSHVITNFEALIRWKHPIYGLVSPNEFIPIAEETGLIHEIGEWGLNEVCRQFMFWKQALGETAPPSISVNLSRKQFAMQNLPDMIAQVLGRYDMPPQQMHIEVTETAVMQDVDYAARVLEEIKNIGCTVVMDDFGTGHSSLACLHHLPFDVLKIDRSFVAGLDRSRDFMAMIHAVCNLAHNLEIDIVAEGIETNEHVTILQSLDCTYGQGFFFSKPLPPHQVVDFMSTFQSQQIQRDAA